MLIKISPGNVALALAFAVLIALFIILSYTAVHWTDNVYQEKITNTPKP